MFTCAAIVRRCFRACRFELHFWCAYVYDVCVCVCMCRHTHMHIFEHTRTRIHTRPHNMQFLSLVEVTMDHSLKRISLLVVLIPVLK